MNISFEMGRFSVARTRIMGWAMLLIVFFHSSFHVAEASFLYVIKNLCDIGVDLFLFVSGVGIWHSLSKCSGRKNYVKNRCLRILPAFLIVNTLWFFAMDIILYRTTPWKFLMDITTLSFWVNGNLTTWYLSSLLVLQLLSPSIKRWIEKVPGILTIIIAIPVILTFVIRLTPLNQILGHLLIIIARIPIYILGLAFGKYIKDNKVVEVNVAITSAIFVVSLCIALVAVGATGLYLPYVMKYLAYCPIAIILSGVVSYIPAFRCIDFWGTHSLETYLLHEKVLWFADNLVRILFPMVYTQSIANAGINFFAILVTVVGSVILQKLCTKVKGKLNA